MKSNNLIFIHKLLKAFADAIIIVFIPLYILKNTNQLSLSMIYLIAYSSFVILYMFIFKRLIQRFGVITIILHFITIIISEAILSFSIINLTTVLIVAGLMGIAQAFYSIPLNLIFAFKDKSTDVAKFQIASNIGKIIFTLISGMILSSDLENSFLFLSIASSVFYIASVFPILFSYKELKEKYDILDRKENYRGILNFWFVIFHIAFGLFQPIMDNVVPLYLYINDLSFQAITIYIVTIEFLKIFANFSAKLLIKRNKEIISITISMIVFMISVTSICFIKKPGALYVLSALTTISFPLTFVPMFKLYCNKLVEKNEVIYGITKRDFEIFSLRPLMYSTSFMGFGLYPCLIIGIIVVPIMYISELKLILNNRKGIER